MVQDVILLKEVFTNKALPAIKGLKPEHDVLALVRFEYANKELFAIVTFHRWTDCSLGGQETLLQPQQLWFYDGIMSFLWCDEKHPSFNKREGNLDWLNRIINEHYEHKNIYYRENHYAKLKISLGEVQ